MEPLRIFTRPPREAQLDLLEFLSWLGGPALFHLKGADSSRCRVVMGGLHGDEPSGFHAVHGILRDLLRSPPLLPVDQILILGNVRAALAGPGFYHRFLPDEEDMNRVWDDLPAGSPVRESAVAIREYLTGRTIEALVDLHNNSGYNPIYSVLLDQGASRVALARNWTRRLVLYGGQKLGTFLETFDPLAPGVVVECGQAGDPEADRRAFLGCLRFLSAADPWSTRPGEGRAHVFRSVARVIVPPDVRLAFTMEHSLEADLTISPRIDRHNFELLTKGTMLAWRGPNGRLQVIDNHGRDVTEEYFVHRARKIHLARSIVPVMMTTSQEAAKSDCLLYMAERVECG